MSFSWSETTALSMANFSSSVVRGFWLSMPFRMKLKQFEMSEPNSDKC